MYRDTPEPAEQNDEYESEIPILLRYFGNLKRDPYRDSSPDSDGSQ